MYASSVSASACKANGYYAAGRLLVDLAAANSMVITTGRAPGDCGQPSYVGCYKDWSSRPDYILLPPALKLDQQRPLRCWTMLHQITA
eukprot:scaffold7454_cov18-Tisochrysis_lutea.AAC.1